MMYFGRKENDEIKIYELEIEQEGKGFYAVKLKDTYEGRLLIKSNIDKIGDDGSIFSESKDIIEKELNKE